MISNRLAHGQNVGGPAKKWKQDPRTKSVSHPIIQLGVGEVVGVVHSQKAPFLGKECPAPVSGEEVKQVDAAPSGDSRKNQEMPQDVGHEPVRACPNDIETVVELRESGGLSLAEEDRESEARAYRRQLFDQTLRVYADPVVSRRGNPEIRNESDVYVA